MSAKRWCLGFVFSSDLRHVILIRKGKSLHIGLWNGVGGALEKDDMNSSLNAMMRECKEETGIQINLSRWVEVGNLCGGNWCVDIYTAREPADVGLSFICADANAALENLSCLNDYETDRAVMMPVKLLHTLKMAPHGAVLAIAALERLQDDKVPILTFEQF